jgi:hypothetical protein
VRESNHIKYVHEGKYVAEVQVTLIDNEGWSPYLSVEDVQKLDTVRVALRSGNIKKAAEYSKVYKMMPVAI